MPYISTIHFSQIDVGRFVVIITEKKLLADCCRSLLGDTGQAAVGDFRAEVEGVPSVL